MSAGSSLVFVREEESEFAGQGESKVIESKERESKEQESKERESERIEPKGRGLIDRGSKERELKGRVSNFIGRPEDENYEAFGSSIGFPTNQRPCDAGRAIDESTPKADVAMLFASSNLRAGSHLSAEERE